MENIRLRIVRACIKKVDIKLSIKDVPEICDNCQCTMMMSQYALL